MSFTQTLLISLQSLSGNKLRSSLTILGIVIGVAAVVAMLGIGRGAQAGITASVTQNGTNLLYVRPGAAQSTNGVRAAAGSGASLTLDDATALQSVSGVTAVAPEVDGRVQVVYQGVNANTSLVGTTPDYLTARNVTMAFGDFVSASQVTGRSLVAVLGNTVAVELFGDPASAVGQSIKVGNSGIPVTVIGVTVAKGGSGFGNQDDEIFVPITTAQTRLIGAVRNGTTTSVNTINVQVANASQIPQVTSDMSALLDQRHKVLSGAEDFTIQNQADILSTLSSVANTLTLFLGGISGISLLVGGIGVMNIMLVSVTERTREIGIRKAVGARRADILTQFLVESAALSLLGGLIGIALGWGIAASMGKINLGGTAITPVVGVDSMLLATVFSAAIGLFFGIYPAMRAASLLPVEALRYE
jgi:putative ABC transport system permease protein